MRFSVIATITLCRVSNVHSQSSEETCDGAGPAEDTSSHGSRPMTRSRAPVSVPPAGSTGSRTGVALPPEGLRVSLAGSTGSRTGVALPPEGLRISLPSQSAPRHIVAVAPGKPLLTPPAGLHTTSWGVAPRVREPVPPASRATRVSHTKTETTVTMPYQNASNRGRKARANTAIATAMTSVAIATPFGVLFSGFSLPAGVTVTSVTLEGLSPPQEVAHAFRDVNSAREDRQTTINAARA